MTNREYKYHIKKRNHKTILDILTKNIQETIDDEIIRLLKATANGETNVESDLIPFGNKLGKK